MAFIDVLDSLLAQKGVTANQMAKDLGLGNSAVTHWRNRGNLPKGDVLDRLAKYFDVSADVLLGEASLPAGEAHFAPPGYAALSPQARAMADAYIQGLAAASGLTAPNWEERAARHARYDSEIEAEEKENR